MSMYVYTVFNTDGTHRTWLDRFAFISVSMSFLRADTVIFHKTKIFHLLSFSQMRN